MLRPFVSFPALGCGDPFQDYLEIGVLVKAKVFVLPLSSGGTYERQTMRCAIIRLRGDKGLTGSNEISRL